MKLCVVGAGAVGGLLAARFALAGEDVTVLDCHQQHLAAIKGKGIELRGQDSTNQIAKVRALERVADAGVYDLVVLAVKAHSLQHVAKELRFLLHSDTVILTVQNGIPWWYFQRHGGALEGTWLQSLDPNRILATKIDTDRVIACVVHPAAVVVAPGIVFHVEGNRCPVGELDGRITDRVKTIEDLFVRAGLKSRVLTDIRAEIWLKALGTLSFNPISALTHATMFDICQFPATRHLAAKMMEEAQSIAERLGISLRHTIEERIVGAEAVGRHKTSMLQDVESGRPLETEALIGAILEMGKLTGTPTPLIESVYALTRLLDRQIQTEGGFARLSKTPRVS